MKDRNVYLTVDEHKKASALIHEMDRHISELLKLMGNKVPKSICNALLKVDRGLVYFKSEMESEMFRRCQNARIEVYYPARTNELE
jgi:hypothetical protein